MLNKLADWFLVGLGVGGALTVLAGLYLANQALRPIRRSWEQQRRFTADASHELRMPLSIIQANAELMLMHPDRSALENSEQISMVLSEVRRMAKLTDQLLLLARSDSGREELLLGPVQLEALIRHVIQLFAPLAELNGVRLDAELASGVELTGDRDKLQQLLVILLDNSLKHTPAGGSIRVVLTRRGQQAAIVVEDTGEGIAEEDLPHIFERFYRGDRARSRGDGGTGLGLAIARWIAEKHGGTIAAASRPGRGTTMTVRLPVAPAGKRIGRFR
jgi:signal transduction histidine kinase